MPNHTMNEGWGSRIARGRLFAQLKNTAIGYLKHPDKLSGLINRAQSKAAAAGGAGALTQMFAAVVTFLRLLRAYASGAYRQVPAKDLILIVAGLLYFVAPIDVIPDFLIGLGFLDDAAVIAWVVRTLKSVVDDFTRWEATRAAAGTVERS